MYTLPLMPPTGRAVRSGAVLLCIVLGYDAPVVFGAQDQNLIALKTLSLEELGNLTVTSVSKSEETLSGAAAAITVVTGEDIRRSGATSLPETLRMVPGMHVGRETSNIWAVSSRGFSSTSSKKLLVLIDTRSIYTPLFAGVMWDVQDLVLEDVERIEVIRGPGATLWGSNAVNGVINITTKNARDTQGLYVASSAGSDERFALQGRYGGRLGERGYYRVFGKYTDRDRSFASGTVQRDDWQLGHGGVRIDWEAGAATAMTLQGEIYGVDAGRLAPSIVIAGRPSPPGLWRTRSRGGNVLARWNHRPSAGSDLQFRVYYDRTHRNDPSFIDDLDTVDADLQHRSTLPGQQELTWGANYRFTSNRNEGVWLAALEPPSSRDQVFSGFIQHQIALGGSFRLTTGTKMEHNGFSGAELQPGVRAAWDIAPAQTLWGAVSRAARIPTRFERDIAIEVTPPEAPTVQRLVGNTSFDSEGMIAFETGYRWQPSTSLMLDVAAYHNRYRGLASLELAPPFMEGGRPVYEIRYENLTDGHARGVEALVTTAPAPWWRLSVSTTSTWLDLTPRGMDLNRDVLHEGSTPRHQLGVSSRMDLAGNVKLDAHFRHMTKIRTLQGVQDVDPVPAYAEIDVRLAWRAALGLELAVVGQNLLHDHHAEFGPPDTRGEIERGVYASVTWRR